MLNSVVFDKRDEVQVIVTLDDDSRLRHFSNGCGTSAGCFCTGSGSRPSKRGQSFRRWKKKSGAEASAGNVFSFSRDSSGSRLA